MDQIKKTWTRKFISLPTRLTKIFCTSQYNSNWACCGFSPYKACLKGFPSILVLYYLCYGRFPTSLVGVGMDYNNRFRLPSIEFFSSSLLCLKNKRNKLGLSWAKLSYHLGFTSTLNNIYVLHYIFNEYNRQLLKIFVLIFSLI